MHVAALRETYPFERRAALTPQVAARFVQQGWQSGIEAGAGEAAGFPDAHYADKGVKIFPDRRAATLWADVVLQVRTFGANPEAGKADLDLMRAGQTWIGMCDPLGNPSSVRQMADRKIALFAMELIPRIARAQSMDVLSSMATVAGYKAVLHAAQRLPKLFPMLMTAAGTLSPAKVLVIGAGVAGLQAIATARRLGAVVRAYDVRRAAREQIESMGARFVELDLDTNQAEGKGGYAQALTDDQLRLQREQLAQVAADCDVCIATAAIPGKPSPLLITAEAVERMAPGSVIVDLAAERGGNCELTQPDRCVEAHGVTILGPTNLASEAPLHASQMYAANLSNFLSLLAKQGTIDIDFKDEIVRETLAAKDGQVQHPTVRGLLQLGPLELPPGVAPANHLATN